MGEKPTNKGGYREGAGRKSLPAAEKKVQRTVSIKPETLAYLQAVALPDEALGQTIDRIVATVREG